MSGTTKNEFEIWQESDCLNQEIERKSLQLRNTDADPDSLEREIDQARKKTDCLVAVVVENFNVVPPDESPHEINLKGYPPPIGQIYFWDWYKEMQKLARQKKTV